MAEIFKAFADIGKGIKDIHDYRKDVCQRKKENKLRRQRSESFASEITNTECYCTPHPALRGTKSDSNMNNRLPYADKLSYCMQRSDSESSTASAPPAEDDDAIDGQNAAILSSSPVGWGLMPQLPSYHQSQKDYGWS